MEQTLNDLLANPTLFWVVATFALWSLPWKGVALWKAAKNNSAKWFVVLLLVNTAAILDILYIFVFSRKGTDNAQN